MSATKEQVGDVRKWFVTHVIDACIHEPAATVEEEREERDRRRDAGETVRGAWRGSAYIAAKDLCKHWNMPQDKAQVVVNGVFQEIAKGKPELFVLPGDPAVAGLTPMKTTENRNGRRQEIACNDYLGLRLLVPPRKHRTRTSAEPSDYGSALLGIDVVA